MRRQAWLAVVLGAFVSLEAHAAFNGFMPLSHSGRVSYVYGYTDSAGNETEVTSLLFGWNAAGYVWRPWFATTSMALNVGLTSSESASSSSKGTSGSGNFSLGVFPRSRFPFSLSYSRSDSRAQQFYDIAQASAEASFRTTRITLRQSYRPRKYNQLYNGWYSSTQFVGEGGGGSTSQVYGLDYKLRVARQTVSVTATRSVADSRGASNKSTSDILAASHVYTPSAGLGVNSLFSYVVIDPSRGSASIDSQASSSFFWRPEHRAFNVSGGARLSEARSENDRKTVIRSLNTNLGLGYRITRSLSMSASVSMGTSDGASVQSLSTAQSASVSYRGERRQWQGFTHSWQWGASGANAATRLDSGGETISTNRQSIATSIGHNVNKSWAPGRNSSISATFSQSGSGGRGSETSVLNGSISHGVSLGWNARGKRGATYINSRLSDSRGFGAQDTVFNNFNLSYAADRTISRLSSINGRASYQASRNTTESDRNTTESENEQEKITSTTKSIAGNITYRNNRPFGIYNLDFRSVVRGSKRIDSPVPSTTLQWESSFRYSLGKLSTVLSFWVSESAGGSVTKSMNFQATRNF